MVVAVDMRSAIDVFPEACDAVDQNPISHAREINRVSGPTSHCPRDRAECRSPLRRACGNVP